MPEDIAKEIQKFFKNLNLKYVAVRSSATAEDSASAAWAGQLESYLKYHRRKSTRKRKEVLGLVVHPRRHFLQL